MTVVQRITGDCRITGNLQVDGSLPTYERTNLQQDTNQPFVIPLINARVHDAPQTNLPGTAADDDLGLAGAAFGTNSLYLTTGDVKAAGCTRYARFQIPIPMEYDAGETLTLRCHAGMQTTVADTSATLDVEAYKSDEEGGIGSDICATAAQSINSLTDADYDFAITPTGLSPGDMLDVRLTVTVADSATGTAVIANVGALQLLADVKG